MIMTLLLSARPALCSGAGRRSRAACSPAWRTVVARSSARCIHARRGDGGDQLRLVPQDRDGAVIVVPVQRALLPALPVPRMSQRGVEVVRRHAMSDCPGAAYDARRIAKVGWPR